MSRSSLRALAAAVTLAVAGSLGCWEQVSYDWFPQMKKQIAIQAYEDTELPRHPEPLSPPEGAVARDFVDRPPLAEMTLAEQDAVPNPTAMTLASLQNGEKLFQRYCATCHGPEGGGNGAVAGPPFGQGPFGLVLPIGGPMSVARGLSDGHIYTTISLGRGRMPRYARIPPDSRWDIVNYVRVLNDPTLTVARGGAQ